MISLWVMFMTYILINAVLTRCNNSEFTSVSMEIYGSNISGTGIDCRPRFFWHMETGIITKSYKRVQNTYIINKNPLDSLNIEQSRMINRSWLLRLLLLFPLDQEFSPEGMRTTCGKPNTVGCSTQYLAVRLQWELSLVAGGLALWVEL